MTARLPTPFYIPLERRRFLKALALASTGFTVPGYLAEALILPPQVTQGPYYPLAKNIPLEIFIFTARQDALAFSPWLTGL